jgi:Cu-Zn family superoxide dismutase
MLAFIPARRTTSATLALSILAMAASIGCKTIPASGARSATATLRDANGREVGTLQFEDHGAAGVLVSGSFQNLSVGQHGIHFHSVGSCDVAGTFSSAGAHFNPADRKHGLANPDGPHAGDLPNLEIGQFQTGAYRATTSRVSLGNGGPTLLDADGSAVVVHATSDDQKTDPAGNSGARIACGVIRAS